MNASGWLKGLGVTAGGPGIVSHAGWRQGPGHSDVMSVLFMLG